jgi:hypothetical protein
MSMFKEIMGWVGAMLSTLVALALAAAGIGFVAGFCFAVARATFKFWS